MVKYSTVVILAKAGIQKDTGCRIKSGMTKLSYLVAELINKIFYHENTKKTMSRKSKRDIFYS